MQTRATGAHSSGEEAAHHGVNDVRSSGGGQRHAHLCGARVHGCFWHNYQQHASLSTRARVTLRQCLLTLAASYRDAHGRAGRALLRRNYTRQLCLSVQREALAGRRKQALHRCWATDGVLLSIAALKAFSSETALTTGCEAITARGATNAHSCRMAS